MTHPLMGLAQATINRALRLDPELDRIFSPLAGKCVAVRIEPGPELAFLFAFEHDGIVILDADARAADAELTGSVSALLGLLPNSNWSAADDGIKVHGDSAVLTELKRALGRLRIDWQEPFAQIFGDTLGQSMTQGLMQMAGSFSRTARSLWLDTAEYLSEESDWLETRTSVNAFCADVDRLRDDTARLEKRLQHFEARLAAHGKPS